jgi:hypothetical protein
MQIFKCANNESTGDFTHIAVFDWEDIAANATSSNQVTIATIPAGGAVELCYVDETVALAGASDITLDVGTTAGDPDEFINALDVDGMTVPVANTGDIMLQGATTTTTLGGALPVSFVASDTPVLVEWNGTVASLTAGQVTIGLRILDPRRF